MRKILSVLLCIAVLLSAVPALAYDSNTAGVENMPEKVEQILNEKWSGWTVTGWVNPAGLQSSAACAFAAIHKDKANRLVAFGYKKDQWTYLWDSVKAVPQAEYGMELLEGSDDGGYVGFVIRAMTAPAFETVWKQQKTGKPFLLTKYIVYDTDASVILETITVYDESVKYEGWKSEGRTVNYRGVTQRELKYFSWRDFPKTPKDLKKGLTAAPEIPAGDLTAQEIKFTGGKKYNVYSAPSEASLRGGNGKALVSTNGWIQVFGEEDGWLLIQYSIDNSHYRFGYIPAKALPKDAFVPQLAFGRTEGRTIEAVTVTDDPLYSGSGLLSLPADTQITFLCTMGNWAYIEGQEDILFRGFVPLSSITTETAQTPFSVFTAEDGTVYDLFVITKLLYGEDHQVSAVTGHYERVVTKDGMEESEPAPGSERTYSLSADFRADMISSMTDAEQGFVNVTDLYKWYIDAYLEGDAFDGHELVFSSDLSEAELDTAKQDFWFVTTQIQLNSREEICYMKYVPVPWA